MRLHLAVSPRIERPNGRVLYLVERDAALLAWLSVEGPTLRGQLCALLWPDSREAQARATLRQRLFQLKKLLGHDVAVGSPILQLADNVEHDLADSHELLGQLHCEDAPALQEWLNGQRARRRQTQRDKLLAEVRALEAAGDVPGALRVALSLLRLEPLSETAHRRVMRLHYVQGDAAAALLAFDACERMLKDEVGTRPSTETLALLATVQKVEAAPPVRKRRELPASILRPPRMVGRRKEAQTLGHAWDAGHVAVLIGEAGIGKTRLLAEFADGQPGIVYSGAKAGDAGVPFATLTRLLRAVGSQAVTTLPEKSRQQLTIVLPELARENAPVESGQRLHLQQRVLGYLQAAKGLVGLMIDDLHFADTATLDLLQSILVDLAPMRCALAYRPTEPGTPLRDFEAVLSEAAPMVPIGLVPLESEELAELVDELNIGLDGRTLAPALQQRTGGVPMFALEMLKQVWMEDAVQTIAGGGPWPRPASVEQLIDRRVARLSPDAVAMARVASVAGADYSLELAEEVLSTPVVHLADAVTELDRAQILKDLSFAHDLVFDAVRRSLPASIAAQLHVKVARWLESRHGEPARVAQHWIDGGQPQHAPKWLALAGQAAGAALRVREALSFFETKASIEEAQGDRDAAFRTRLRIVLDLVSQACTPGEADALCDHLDRLAGDDGRLALAWLARSATLRHRREQVPAESFARRALEAANRTNDLSLQRHGQVNLFGVVSLGGRSDDALMLAEQCLPWIEVHDDPDVRMQFHVDFALLNDRIGRLAMGRRHHDRAMVIAQASGDLAPVVSILGNLAGNRAMTGQVQAAVDLRKRALALNARSDAPRMAEFVIRTNLAANLIRIGGYGEALQNCEAAEEGLRVHMPPAVALVLAYRGECWLHLGQINRAVQEAKRALAWPDVMPLARARAHVLAHELGLAVPSGQAPHLDAAWGLIESRNIVGIGETIMIQRTRSLPPAEALQALSEIRERARQREQMAQVLETHIRTAELSIDIDPQAAAHHASTALALSETIDPAASYRGGLWLHCALALLAGGLTDRGHATWADGRHWVETTAIKQVPPPFRESFLHRNPINARLLAPSTSNLLKSR